MKKILSITALILSASLLQGCAVAIIGAGVGATKMAIDPRTTGTQIDDNTLDAKINTKLGEPDNKQALKSGRFVVSSYNNNVLLLGQSPSQAQINKAVSIIENVEGVNKVYNQVRLGTPISASTVANDTWITTKVKSQLVANNQTKARDIKVITENGEVFLTGIATRDEGRLASEIASQVNGVKLVTLIFTYTD